MTTTNTYQGAIMVRGKGTGFVAIEDFLEDILITSDNLGFALNGDIVEIALLPEKAGERREGKSAEGDRAGEQRIYRHGEES